MKVSRKVRATGWETVWEIAKGVLILIVYGILKKLCNHPKLLLRGARLLFRAARWTVIKSVGVSLAFLGGFVLCVIPFASWIFVQASAESPASLVQYSIAALIAAAVYAFGGSLLFGTGLWLLSPSSRVGKFGKSVVLTHVLRR